MSMQGHSTCQRAFRVFHGLKIFRSTWNSPISEKSKAATLPTRRSIFCNATSPSKNIKSLQSVCNGSAAFSGMSCRGIDTVSPTVQAQEPNSGLTTGRWDQFQAPTSQWPISVFGWVKTRSTMISGTVFCLADKLFCPVPPPNNTSSVI